LSPASLFLYGTLLDPAVLVRMAGRAGLHRRAVPARLPGHRRVVLRGTPYPTLLRGRGVVAGLLLRAGPATLRRLALYEGPLYRLRPCRVLTRRGARRALAWVAPAWRARGSTDWKDPAVTRP
jgi:gamma-glutamylcyclotransferase (GGCT)/AIG2-like uncharacterized protein YtfP